MRIVLFALAHDSKSRASISLIIHSRSSLAQVRVPSVVSCPCWRCALVEACTSPDKGVTTGNSCWYCSQWTHQWLRTQAEKRWEWLRNGRRVILILRKRSIFPANRYVQSVVSRTLSRKHRNRLHLRQVVTVIVIRNTKLRWFACKYRTINWT